MIEQEIFKKCVIEQDKLLQYGFHKEQDIFYYEKEIENNSFKIIIQVKNNKITGKIIDQELQEEYLSYRIESQTGEFVNKIKNEFIELLEDIKNNCCSKKYFISNQANRISNYIKEKYEDDAEFLWEDDDSAVFRNNRNKKWYGIIMNINKQKLGGEDKKVEVMNVKLPPEKINELVTINGYYRAYHMNKKYWITYLLDDTIKDEELETLIDISYEYTKEINTWVIPTNPKVWDIIHCFDDKKEILWKEIKSIQENDDIYIYVGSPYSCIKYKCRVKEKNIPSPYEKFDKCMMLVLIEEYDDKKYPLNVLKEYDLKSIRGPRRIPSKLLKELEKTK